LIEIIDYCFVNFSAHRLKLLIYILKINRGFENEFKKRQKKESLFEL